MYRARSLHSLIPCLLTDKNFKNNSEKGHSRNISMTLFQNLTNSFREDFLEICVWSYSPSSPHSPEPCSWTDQNFTNDFLERSLQEHFCEPGIRSHLLCCPYRLGLTFELNE